MAGGWGLALWERGGCRRLHGDMVEELRLGSEGASDQVGDDHGRMDWR